MLYRLSRCNDFNAVTDQSGNFSRSNQLLSSSDWALMTNAQKISVMNASNFLKFFFVKVYHSKNRFWLTPICILMSSGITAQLWSRLLAEDLNINPSFSLCLYGEPLTAQSGQPQRHKGTKNNPTPILVWHLLLLLPIYLLKIWTSTLHFLRVFVPLWRTLTAQSG